MEDMHGGGPWSYRKTIGSCSCATSSSSGTTLSTNYTSGTGGSYPLPFDLDLVVEPPQGETSEKLEHIKGLVEEFCTGGNGNNVVSALERWFSELGVDWVLHLADDDASTSLLWQDQHDLADRWIQALADITESILDTYSCFSDTRFGPSAAAEELQATTVPDPVQFSRFAQEAMLKMLSFVDAMVAPNPSISREILDSDTAPSPFEKLKALLDVRGALFMASFLIQPPLFYLSSSAQAERTLDDMETLRSEKDEKLAEGIWNAMEEVRIRILSSSWDTQHESANIHKVTRSIERYIRLLDINHRSVDQIVRKAANIGAYVPEICDTNPLTSLITEMVSCVEEKLTKMSQSFPNQSLRLLFLINNLHFLWQQLHPMYDTKFHMPALTCKIEDYIENYLQVAWVPVLSCLHSNQTPLPLGRYSPLPKFESKFRKLYTAQKLWKVPDPELRKRLRKAITEKLTSGLTKYLEDNNIGSNLGSTLTPQELEEMLQELFEG